MPNTDKKLLIVSSTFPRYKNDHMPRFIHDLGQALCAHFSEVHVLAPGAKGAKKSEDMSGMKIHRYTYMYPGKLQVLAYDLGMIQNLKKYPWAWLTVPFFLGIQILSIIKLCKRHGIKTVNSHWLVFQGLAAALARKRVEFRHVLHIHAGGLFAVRRLPPCIGKKLARFIVARSDKIICASNFIKASLDDWIGFDSRASVCCMGVDTVLFSESAVSGEQADSIAYIGRLVEKKGVGYLLEAMSYVFKENPGVTLKIIGTGQLEEALKAKAEELGLIPGPVEFLGRKMHKEIVRYIAESRVVVVPSIVDRRGETEGMPTVILEALAMGKRVVASDVAGASDVIRHGENGWLARPQDAIDLSKKILQALNDSNPEITRQALATAAYHSWPKLAERYAKFLMLDP